MWLHGSFQLTQPKYKNTFSLMSHINRLSIVSHLNKQPPFKVHFNVKTSRWVSLSGREQFCLGWHPCLFCACFPKLYNRVLEMVAFVTFVFKNSWRENVHICLSFELDVYGILQSTLTFRRWEIYIYMYVPGLFHDCEVVCSPEFSGNCTGRC